MILRCLVLGVCLAAPLLAACTQPTVIRVVDGREVAGRFIPLDAYVLYARAAESEARGDFESARTEYLEAAGRDPQNVEVWTRVGAVSCAAGNFPQAAEAFAHIADRANDYEPFFRERALCALRRAPLSYRDTRFAFADATSALILDPKNEDTALLFARAAEAAGDLPRAETTLRELVARSPGRIAGLTALHAFALRRGDAPAVARTEAALATLAPALATSTTSTTTLALPAPVVPPQTAPAQPAAKTLQHLDEALARDALDEARIAARTLRMPPAELAVRAAALGRAAIARAQADLVFQADPASASAAIALAVACNLTSDDGGVVRALADANSRTTPPSPLARLLLAELLERRTDAEAARLYLGAFMIAPTEVDPLLRGVALRVIARIALKPAHESPSQLP